MNFYFLGCFNFYNHEVQKGKRKREKYIQIIFQGEKKFLLSNRLPLYFLKQNKTVILLPSLKLS